MSRKSDNKIRSSADVSASPVDDDLDIEQLMMPGTYLPRRHRDRSMPPQKPRLHAKPSNCVWTSETPKDRKT